MAFIIRIYHEAWTSEYQITNSIFTQLRDVEDKQRLGRPRTSTADDNVCREDAPIKEGRHIKLTDLAREPDTWPGIIHPPRTRLFARYYPLTENQTFRQVLSIDREPDFRQILSIDREPDFSPDIIHRPRNRLFARYYPSTENQTFHQVLSTHREPDFSPDIIHRPRTRLFVMYYPLTKNQTFR